jgi:hydrocephalus-inducing protein
MTFNLRVASDGEARDSVIPTGRSSGDLNRDDADDYNFKEFSLTPSIGIIPPQSEVKVLVEFVPHFIKKYETSLIVDIEDVCMELMNLPISARSIVPNITLLTTDIDMGRCFIYYPYEKTVKLSNETPLKARYYILPSKSQDPFKFTSNQAEGVIEPNSVKEISVFSEALQLNDIEGDLLIKINGSVDTPLKCHYVCLSQGPVVQIHPKEIDWGLTTVLQKSSREILLSNESLIEANFTTFMVGKTFFSIRVPVITFFQWSLEFRLFGLNLKLIYR